MGLFIFLGFLATFVLFLVIFDFCEDGQKSKKVEFKHRSHKKRHHRRHSADDQALPPDSFEDMLHSD